jgi:transposase-like protein
MNTTTPDLTEVERIPPGNVEDQPHEEDACARKLRLQDEMRACWKRGEGWQIEFGRLLRKYRTVTLPGEWIKFLKSEFDLHRQTAWNWMRKAAEADGVSFLDEPQTRVDEPDTFAETVHAEINDAHDNVENAKKKIAPFRMILDDVTPAEREQYQAACKENRERVQDVSRILFSPMAVPYTRRRNGTRCTRRLLDLYLRLARLALVCLPEHGDLNPIEDEGNTHGILLGNPLGTFSFPQTVEKSDIGYQGRCPYSIGCMFIHSIEFAVSESVIRNYDPR